MPIKESELVLAPNGSLYHIHLTGENLADNVLLVGDPERVNMFKEIFETVEYESMNRELHALTGKYHGERALMSFETGKQAISTSWPQSWTQPQIST